VIWGDANARARGLGTHLARPEALHALAEPGTLSSDPLALDHLMTSADRRATDRLAVLARWLGPRRTAVLAVVYERLDLEQLRRLLRSLARGAGPAERARAVHATPGLPPGLLDRLVRAGSIGQLIRILSGAGHAGGAALSRVRAPGGEGSPWPGLFEAELALAETYARRAGSAARHGDAVLRAVVAYEGDLLNFGTLLLRSEWGEVNPDRLFLPGGGGLTRARFVALGDMDSGPRRVALSRLRGTTLVARVAARTQDPGGADVVAWQERITALRRAALRDPLGSAPLLLVLCRIEAEASDLRWLAHAEAVGLPPESRRAGLVAA